MPDYRETIIRISHDDRTAEVWTEQAGLASRLKRLGFREIKAHGRGVWLKGHRRQISYRKVGSMRGSGPKRAIPEAFLKRHAALKAKKAGL